MSSGGGGGSGQQGDMHTLRASEVLLLTTWLPCSLELIVKFAQEEDPGSVSAPDPVPHADGGQMGFSI